MDRRRLKSSSSSSSQSVVLQDDDLLTLILLRVPRRKLKVLKRVSRQWHSLITTPHFRSLLPGFRASALFIQHRAGDDHSKLCSVSLDDHNSTPFRIRNHAFAHDPGSNDPEEIEILSCCSGLLLCSTFSYSPGRQIDYYVYNISTGQLTNLPKPPRHSRPVIRCVGLAFDPSKSLDYKVIVFLMSPVHNNVNGFHIYSSDTKTWKASAQPLIPTQETHFVDGVYWNGCIHWLGQDSNSNCFYFNVDEEWLKIFPRPPLSAELPITRPYFGESADHLHYAQVCPFDTSLSVYEMKSDYSEWFLKYHIDLVPISKAFPEMNCHFFNPAEMNPHFSYPGKNNYNVAVISIIRRENFNEDSFLILKIPGKIVRYNLVDGSFKVIWDFVVLSSWSCGNEYKAWSYFE